MCRVCVCVCACVRACVRARARVCVYELQNLQMADVTPHVRHATENYSMFLFQFSSITLT
jgi:hypothetical protein